MNKSPTQPSHETRGLVLAIGSVLCFSATSLLLSYAHAEHGVDVWTASVYRAVVVLTVILSGALLDEQFTLLGLAGGGAILYASYRIVVAKC